MTQTKTQSSNDLTSLRPGTLDEYIGQAAATNSLRVFLQAINERGFPNEHVLFYGPPGIGKTTLAHIIAKELGGDMKVTSGAAVEHSGDLAAILTNLQDNDVLFIDEIHRIPKSVEEMLYPVMEDGVLDIVIGKGPSARTMRLPVPHIMIVGATTRLALLSAPLRDRFGILQRLDYYTEAEMVKIILRSCALLELPIDEAVAKEIAKRSRRTPRLANRIIKRARDIVHVQNYKKISSDVLSQLFSLMELDELGLTDIDQQYMRAIAEKFQNTPVGVSTLASALSEDKRTIEEFIEPYLLQIGFIKKTSRGRIVTPLGLKHLKLPVLPIVEQDKLL